MKTPFLNDKTSISNSQIVSKKVKHLCSAEIFNINKSGVTGSLLRVVQGRLEEMSFKMPSE